MQLRFEFGYRITQVDAHLISRPVLCRTDDVTGM